MNSAITCSSAMKRLGAGLGEIGQTHEAVDLVRHADQRVEHAPVGRRG